MVLVFLFALIGGCEQPAAVAPTPLAVVERPVRALEVRGNGVPLLIPAAALVERGGIPGVFVLQPAAAFPPVATGADGKRLPQARFRMVKVGKTLGIRIEILSGLRGGESLVLGDLSGVYDGSVVVVER